MTREKRVRLRQILLFALGLALTTWLILFVRTEEVLAALRRAAPWLPIVALFEIALIVIDVVSVRVLVGDAKGQVPARLWLRCGALAYAASIMLPTGRAAGEVVRSALLVPVLGITRAARACAGLQAFALVANAAISLISASASRGAGGPSQLLTLALCGNALVCGLLATAVFALLRNGRFTRWVQERLPRFSNVRFAAQPDSSARSVAGKVVTLCVMGRLLQTGEYGVILSSLGSPLAARSAFTAQGIHLVGAAVGDFIPNQMGATEGSYLAFAGPLGFGEEPARALSIALTAHVVQLGLAIACLLGGALMAGHAALPERS